MVLRLVERSILLTRGIDIYLSEYELCGPEILPIEAMKAMLEPGRPTVNCFSTMGSVGSLVLDIY